MKSYYIILTLLILVRIASGQELVGDRLKFKNNGDNYIYSEQNGLLHHIIGTYPGWDKEGVYIAGYNSVFGSLATKRVYIGQSIIFDLTNNSLLANTIRLRYPNRTVNWNKEWQNGFFESYDAENGPEPSGWFWGLNIGHTSDNDSYLYGGQIAIKNNNQNPALYFRSKNVAGIGTWAKIIHSVGNQQINGNLFIRNATAETGFGKGANFVVSNNNTSSFGRHSSLIFAVDDLGTTPLSGISGVYDTWTSTNGAGMRMSFFTKDAAAENLPTEKMTITGNGNIGIGTTSPSNKLEVNGTIRAKEIKVEAAPWPDYVFADDYQLKDLSEVEQYINANNHLPDVPAAETLEQQGVNLGEMNRILLKKVEELTLYVIQLQKSIEEKDQRLKLVESTLELKK